MKRIFQFAIVALVAVSFTSCKKKDNNSSYTCTCTKTDNVMTTVIGSTAISDSKDKAKTKCADMAATYKGLGGATVTCAVNDSL